MKPALDLRRMAALGVAFALAGCGINCDRNPDEPPVPYKDGTTVNGFYDSAPDAWEGPYLNFPAGRTYRFFHGLGGIPRDIEPWLAFGPRCGAGGTKLERSSPGAGNQVTIETPTDPDFFDVRNDTCSEVCLRVTASDPIVTSLPIDPEDPDDAGDVEPDTDAGAP